MESGRSTSVRDMVVCGGGIDSTGRGSQQQVIWKQCVVLDDGTEHE